MTANRQLQGNILVFIKWIVDPDQRVTINPNTGLVYDGDQEKVINPLDLTALEAGLAFAEKWGGQVVAATIGTDSSAARGLRIALAMGAHRAIMVPEASGIIQHMPKAEWSNVRQDGTETQAVESEANMGLADPGGVLGGMVALCRRERPFLVLMGRQSADEGRRMLGGMLAQLLDIPHGSNIIKLQAVPESIPEPTAGDDRMESNGKKVEPRSLLMDADCEMDDNLVSVQMPTPCLFTVGNRLCVPRKPSLAAYARAGRSKLEELPAGWEEMGEGAGEQSQLPRQWTGPALLRQTPTPPRVGGHKMLNVENFARELLTITKDVGGKND